MKDSSPKNYKYIGFKPDKPMNSKITKSPVRLSIACSLLALGSQIGSSAEFEYKLVDDSFQQLWSNPIYWTLVSGTDEGASGYPDATDTLTMDRSTTTSRSTRLAIEGGPPFEVAGIKGKGGPDRDVVLKFGDFTLGDLEVEESANSFLILSERDKNFTITGVISGAGDLELQRLGGFSDGVDPDELTTFAGDSPNTITGNIRLYNSSDKDQPAYWVADKVGALGQTPQLTLEGRVGLSGEASLQITANAVGGEGAIDDDATTVLIGPEGVLSVDAGVNEGIGEGKLFIDLEGVGTYTEIAPGTYDKSEDWIIGDGTVTVGVPSAGLVITEIEFVPDPESPMLTLTWNSSPGRSYSVVYSTDMINWDSDLDDGVVGDEGDSTTKEFDLSGIPEFAEAPRVYFRIEETL